MAKIKQKGAAVITTPPVPIILGGEGDLKIESKFGDGEWEPLRNLKVGLMKA